MDITFIDETEKVPTEEIKEIENLLQFAAGFLEIAEDTEMSVTLQITQVSKWLIVTIGAKICLQMSSVLL